MQTVLEVTGECPLWLFLICFIERLLNLDCCFKNTELCVLWFFFLSFYKPPTRKHFKPIFQALGSEGSTISPTRQMSEDYLGPGWVVTLTLGHLPCQPHISAPWALPPARLLLHCAPSPCFTVNSCTALSRLPLLCVHGNNFSFRGCMSIKLDDWKSTGLLYVVDKLFNFLFLHLTSLWFHLIFLTALLR